MVLLFLAIHIIICIGVLISSHWHLWKQTDLLYPMVVSVPLWGFLCLCIKEYYTRQGKVGTKVIELEKLEINDAKYRNIDMEQGSQETVVPLEEALLVNNAQVRRSMMLDILHKNPNEYISMLQRARFSEDAEVTHYATVTMMEILNDYENRIHEYTGRLKKEPGNRQALEGYIGVLQEYIASDLISGNILLLQRRKLKELLAAWKVWGSRKEFIFLSIENDLALGENAAAFQELARIREIWQEDERVYMLLGQYYDNVGDNKGRQQLFAEIREKRIYLSQEGREWMRFWQGGKGIYEK